jgi:hypothetical protein
MTRVLDKLIDKLIQLNNYLKRKYPDKDKQARGKKILLDMIEEMQK